MKQLSWLIAFLLIPVLFTTSLSFITNKTILNASFLDKKATEANVYQDVVPLLPEQLFGDQKLSQKEKAELVKKFNTILTPQALQGKVDDALKQSEAFLKQGNAEVSVDLRDIGNQLRAAGVPVPEEQFAKPLTLPEDVASQVKEANQQYNKTRQASLITCVVLLLALVGIAIKERYFTSLMYALGVSALLQVGLYFGTKQLPPLIDSKLAFDNALMQNYKPILERFITAITTDLSREFLTFAMSFGVATIVVFVVSRFIKPMAQSKLAESPATAAKA